jgi:hypothetical protein
MHELATIIVNHLVGEMYLQMAKGDSGELEERKE